MTEAVSACTNACDTQNKFPEVIASLDNKRGMGE